jgi:hypothetical protein
LKISCYFRRLAPRSGVHLRCNFSALRAIPCSARNSEFVSPKQGFHFLEQGIHRRHARTRSQIYAGCASLSARASTSSLLRDKEDMGGWDKPGHDDT